MKLLRPFALSAGLLLALSAAAFAAGEEEGAAPAAGFNAAGYPIVDEPVTISVVWQKWPSHVKDPSEMIVPGLARETTGVNVDWIAVNGDAWVERTNLMLAAGDLPDTFGAPLSDFNVVSNGEAGAFVPMNDLLDRFAPNVNAIFDKKPTLRPFITASDGNIYSLFRLNEGSWTTTCPLTYLNKPWLDALGAEVPTTTEEYYELLLAVKNAGDLNGNGEADEVPLSFRFGTCHQGMSTFLWAHGLPVEEGHGDNRDLMMVRDGKAVYAPTQEGFRDTAKYLHRLWEAGLIDPESFSQDAGQYYSKLKQDQLFSFNSWWAQNVVDTTRWLDWEYLPALKAPGYEPQANYRFDWTRGLAPITAAAEHPEVVMRWIDYWYEPLNSLTTMEGPLGVRVIENDDGTYGVAPTPEGLGLSEWRDLETIGPGFITSIDIDMYLNMFIFEGAEMCGTVKYDTYSAQWPEMYWPRPMLPSAQINEEQAILPDIQALVKKTLARWITEGGADEEWDQFQEDMNSIGLPRLLEIWQENLDKFLDGTGGVTPRPYDKGTGHPVRPL